VFGIYLFTFADAYRFNEIVVPTGDPFTYTNTWLDIMNVNKKNYFNSFFEAMGWYTMQSIIVYIFSPILAFDPVSISIMNYVIFLFTALITYSCLNQITKNGTFSLIIVCLYLLMPWHYGYTRAISLYALQLDTIFINLLFSCSFLSIAALLSGKLSYRLLLGLTAGFVVWSRANSPVMIVTCIGAIGLTFIFFYGRSIRNICLLLLFSFLIFILMALLYYSMFLHIVLSYYAPLQEFAKAGKITASFILNVLMLIPGTFIAGAGQDIVVTKAFSIFSHIIVITAGIFGVIKNKNNKNDIVNLFLIAGTLIYFFVFTVYLSLFRAADTFYYQPYSPSLIGLFFVLTGATLYLWKHLNYFIKRIVNTNYNYIIMFCFVLFATHLINKKGMQIPYTHGSDNAKLVREIANNPIEYIGTGRVSFLWYGMYNTPIFSYYRKLNHNPPIVFNDINSEFSFYSNEFWPKLWIPTTNIVEENISKAINLMLKEADIFIVPENLNCYKTADPYPLYKSVDILQSEFKKYQGKLYVTGTLQDYGCKLIILSKKNNKTLLTKFIKSPPKLFFENKQ
jgi:hypothetical protein